MGSYNRPKKKSTLKSEEILGLLLRSYEDRVAEIVRALSPDQLRDLAALCQARSYALPLTQQILAHCGSEPEFVPTAAEIDFHLTQPSADYLGEDLLLQ
ncbi:hypothetical protein NPA31_014450 [Aurantimonas sp. MSK8Z-1]|uniref:hypothetical protein n=1 Tax=Mangrovibrevibacter kandeliae TaxID=2968473 RepID=UPI0021198F01|nr:hypothetical protein [Aurantimonas sp. MSK8Z-1]MCW4116164.1 hypothetical protein [Aurantimonas sp. MSK8Z-1]